MRKLLVNWFITVILFAVLGLVYYYHFQYYILAGFLIGQLVDYLSEIWNKKKKIDELKDKLTQSNAKLKEMEEKLSKYESKINISYSK